MNKTELLKLLSPYLIESSNSINSNLINSNLRDDLAVDDISINLQEASCNQIVFYKVNNNVEKFWERYQKRSGDCVVIVNQVVDTANTKNIIVIKEGSEFLAQKVLLDRLFPIQKDKVKLVGITGTNGKTTTVNLACQIANQLDIPALSLGTLGVNSATQNLIKDIGGTTPSYIDLVKLIHRFQDQYQVFFMEISSHGLEQNRLYDFKFAMSAWCSFTQDHLDYHKTMDNYFLAKTKIFTDALQEGGTFITPYRQTDLEKKIKGVIPKNINWSHTKSLASRGYGLQDLPPFFKPIFNQENLEIALDLNEKLAGKEIKIDIKKLKSPDGRFSIIEFENLASMAIIDYAHTPDALKKILYVSKQSFPEKQVTAIFGCGGDRDRSKRPIMGQIAQDYADKIIITSDNPRTEDPKVIINDILKGISHHITTSPITSSSAVTIIPERKQAILHALKNMGHNEIIVIAGKGHEDYQEINGVKYPFSDYNIVLEYMNRKLL